MKLRRILVVYKKSSYQMYARERRDPRFIRLLKNRHVSAARFLSSHQSHGSSLHLVRKILAERNLKAEYVYRSHPFRAGAYDLVLTVGGDGTFLEASHGVLRTPMLGVNSSPADSVGIFCGVRADQLAQALDGIEAGEMPITEITRLSVKLGRRRLPIHLLNDVLISHVNPAATSRYLIKWRNHLEEQKSSGIWVATPVGSTAAIGSAGGARLPVASRSFQFLSRELYRPAGFKFQHVRGILHPREKIIVVSKMRTGRVFLDGPHRSEPFPIGETLEVRANAPRLRVYAFNEKRRKRF